MTDHDLTPLTAHPPERLVDTPSELWALDSDLVFLNHGSFGAVPRPVLEAQSAWRLKIERDPIEMIGRRMSELLEPSRWAAGELINCDPEAVGFVANATTAINAVLRSMTFAPGDRLVAPNHVYNAIRRTMQWVAERDGAEYVEIELPLPATDGTQLADDLLDALPDRTRLLLIDEISSPTAIRFPIEHIISTCRSRDIEVIVDGAHAPGMVEVDIAEQERLGALAWTGNLHKWCFVPKGCAVLHVHRDHRDTVHPPTISHHLGEGFQREFEWQGTIDFTPWLTVPSALAFIEETFGWDRLRAHNHHLATWAQAYLCEHWGSRPLTPLDGSLLGSMAAVVLPPDVQTRFAGPEVLQVALYDEHRIEAPVHAWGSDWIIRVSAQAYNHPDQYARLAEAVDRLASNGPSMPPRIRVNPL